MTFRALDSVMTLPGNLLTMVAVALLLMISFTRNHSDPQNSQIKSMHSDFQIFRDYYVAPGGNDSHTGSAAHPWKTIQHAARMVAAGSTVHVAPGLYTGEIDSSTSGTPADRIRFVSTTPWGAKIHSSSESVWNNRGNYVDIEAFE